MVFRKSSFRQRGAFWPKYLYRPLYRYRPKLGNLFWWPFGFGRKAKNPFGRTLDFIMCKVNLGGESQFGDLSILLEEEGFCQRGSPFPQKAFHAWSTPPSSYLSLSLSLLLTMTVIQINDNYVDRRLDTPPIFPRGFKESVSTRA